MSGFGMHAVALAAIVALGGSGAAQTPPDLASAPERLRAIVETDLQMCREQGATAEIAPTHIQKGDFDGDGAADYLIDQSGMTCPGAASLYCGNSPCPVYALLSADGFAESRHLPGDVFEPTVRPQGGIAVVETSAVDAAGGSIRLRWMFRGGAWRSALIRRD